MPLIVPPAVNYQSPLVAVPSRVLSEPNEGRKSIPAEVIWATMGGANKTVSFNLQNNATLEITQIVALKIDNSMCGAAVRFMFPDTGETVTVPAYTADAVIEVFSNAKEFYLLGSGTISGDVTRFQILNFLPPPVVIPAAADQQVAQAANISSSVLTTSQIIAAGINGTLQNLVVQFGVSSPAADSNASIAIKDGTGKQIAYASVFVKTAIAVNVNPIVLGGLQTRFQNGLTATIGGAGIASGEFNVNAFYRLP